eukprot:CCRYP_014936-RF/>CCRYP_014936-RF protein AED:0.49 eAED:1.00 QI:0/0/0/1/0/0/2/0/95
MTRRLPLVAEEARFRQNPSAFMAFSPIVYKTSIGSAHVPTEFESVYIDVIPFAASIVDYSYLPGSFFEITDIPLNFLHSFITFPRRPQGSEAIYK